MGPPLKGPSVFAPSLYLLYTDPRPSGCPAHTTCRAYCLDSTDYTGDVTPEVMHWSLPVYPYWDIDLDPAGHTDQWGYCSTEGEYCMLHYALYKQSGHPTFYWCKGKCQNSLPLTTNFSQKFAEPSKGVSYPLVSFADVSQN